MSKKEKEMSNALAISETLENLPAAVTASDWGAVEELETTDLYVPKIFHQQGLSEFVKQGLARPGDWCDSLTGEVLAKKENALQVIIFGSYKTMVISKQISEGKFKLDRIITILPENAKEMASKPLIEQTKDGLFKNNLQYNFYCLLPHKITELPYVLTLGSTKTKAAKKINTMLYKLSTVKRPGASIVFALNSVEEKNDQGSWYGMEVTQGRNVEPEELLRAHAWYLKSKSQKFVAAEEDAKHDDDSIPF